MSETPKDKDQKAGDELLRRMLKTPPKPNKKDAEPKPGAPRLKKDSDKVGESLKDGRKAK